MGSEMCIRDRPHTVDVEDPENPGQCLDDREARRLNLDFVKGGNCLLYTSDAADERSSVDLGGRRIIKKKKIKTIYRVVVHEISEEKSRDR